MSQLVKKIMIFIDGTEQSVTAAQYAICLSAGTGAELIALYVVNTRAVDDEIFTEIFAKHLFNDVERMPDAIKILGECASLPLSDSRGLYHTLVEPLRLPTTV